MKTTRRQFFGQVVFGGAALAIGGAAARPDKTPFPVLAASGSPGTLGLAHGRAFTAQVKHNVAFYLRYLSKRTGREPQRILSIARSFAPVLKAKTPALLEEIQGIAAGAHCSVAEILAVNARTDLLVLGRRRTVGGQRTRPATPGCTAMTLQQRVAGRNLLALGQNWDWDPALRKNSVILRLQPDGGPRVVTFAEAGMVGKIGYNSRRLGVCLNFLRHPSDDPEREPGVPVHCLLRAVMGCCSLAEARQLVAQAPRCASANFLLAQAAADGPVAEDLEWTPTTTASLLMQRGILVHTNHFKAETLSQHVVSGNSFERDRRAARMAAALRNSSPDPVDRMRRILALGDEHPVALSRASTQAGIIMDLTRDCLLVCAGPPHQGRWVALPGVAS